MAINSSPEIIREMNITLRKTVNEIQKTQTNIKSAMQWSADWNDAQGQQYRALMKRIAQLTDSPTSTLVTAMPKLEKLAQALDAYGRVRF